MVIVIAFVLLVATVGIHFTWSVSITFLSMVELWELDQKLVK